MKHEGAMFACDPAFRNVLKKGKKRKDGKEEKERMPVPVGTVEAVFKKGSEGLFAMIEGKRMSVSAYSDKDVSEGETWRCMVDRKEAYRPELIPIERIAEKPEVKEVPAEAPKAEKKVAVAEAPSNQAETDGLKTEIERLKKENAELRRSTRVLEGYKDLCDEKDATIKEQKRTIESLSTQVNVLNGKVSDKSIGALEFRIEGLEDDVESRDREIRMLRDRLKALGDEHVKAIPHLPPVMKATKNGSTLLFRDSVEDGRYAVYVNPRTHRLMIVPDAEGAIRCENGEMRVPSIGLQSIGGDAGPRRVGIDAVGNGWEIILA